MRILVIDESHPGHLTQSRGLAQALAARTGGEVDVFAVRMTLRGSFRPLLKQATDLARRGLPDFLLRRAYAWSDDARGLRADLVVASGGDGLPFAVSIARRLGARLVYCGDPRPYPPHWCDVILSPVPVPGHPAVIDTELLVTEMSPELLLGRGGEYRRIGEESGGRQLGAVLIGGDSRSHRYTREDWIALADGLNRLGEQGWRWLVSTSRRTPPEAEQLLRERLGHRWLVKGVWWHAHPERTLHDFLAAADVVFVTQDSLSMLSEAIAAGRPAVALVPAEVRPSAYLEAVLAVQEQRRRLRRLPLAGLGAAVVDPAAFLPVTDSLSARYAQDTLTRL